METVPLYGKHANGRVALVDDEDYDLVIQHRWRLRLNPSGNVYAITRTIIEGHRKDPFMHNLITGIVGIDHINGDGLDNQRSNLRPASPKQNLQHKRPQGGVSEYKGVSWHRGRNKWAAYIKTDKSYYLGLFTSEEDAARAYDLAASEAFGKFAWLNFPG